MILKFTNSSYKYNGRVQGEIWTSSNTRGIARNRVRPNPKSHGLVYEALFTLTAARNEWEGLSESTQSDWETFAASTFGWPLEGSPRYMNGEDFFANYLTVLRTINPAASVPAVPSAGPIWQDRPKFFEIAQWVGGVYTLKAETAFDENTVLLFSGLPPTATIFKPDFSKEIFIGSHEFTDGLDPDEEWDGINTMMTDAFGTITSDLKVWGRVWEVIDGYIRTIKDPCGPDPGSAPPVTATSFEYEIVNGYAEDIDFGDFAFFDFDGEQIATIDVSGLAGNGTQSGTADLDEGYDVDDLNYWYSQGFWVDMTPWVTGVEFYDGSGLFEYTIPDPYG